LFKIVSDGMIEHQVIKV